jgi:hypothetical protein
MSPIICRCCGQPIEPVRGRPRSNPNVCAPCEVSKGFDTHMFDRPVDGKNKDTITPLPGPKQEDARPQRR